MASHLGDQIIAAGPNELKQQGNQESKKNPKKDRRPAVAIVAAITAAGLDSKLGPVERVRLTGSLTACQQTACLFYINK